MKAEIIDFDLDKEPVTQDSIEKYKLHRQQIKDIEKKKDFRTSIVAIIFLWFITLAGLVFIGAPLKIVALTLVPLVVFLSINYSLYKNDRYNQADLNCFLPATAHKLEVLSNKTLADPLKKYILAVYDQGRALTAREAEMILDKQCAIDKEENEQDFVSALIEKCKT